MKKILSVIMILVFMLCGVSAFAQTPDSDYTVTIDTEGLYKFVDVGTLPDLTKVTVTKTGTDVEPVQISLDKTYLPDGLSTAKTGLLQFSVNVFETEFQLEFIVIDRKVDMKRFTDFNKDYWGYKKIRHVVMAGFFNGVSDSEFGVRDNMTRAQFCQMIYNIYKDDSSVINPVQTVVFSDVGEQNWFYKAVSACAASGIVNGIGDGLFAPNSPISRQDAALMMMRILQGADALASLDVQNTVQNARENGVAALDFDSTSEYAKPAVAAALGVIYYGDSDGNITPKANITRAECASMMSNLFFKDFEDEPVRRLVYLSPENRTYNAYAGVDTDEHTEMQKVAESAKAMLEALGYDVFIADINTSIRDEKFNRAIEAKQMGADVYVALHSNAFSGVNDGKYQGCICFYNGNNEGASQLSQAIYDRLSALTPTEDGGSRNDTAPGVKPFVEVRLPEMANVLIEVEFHDYKPYAEWIYQNTDNIATAVTLGIDEYLKTLA